MKLAPADAIISVRGLTKVYRSPGEDSVEVNALAGVDLDIRRGEFVAIMGPSGSGKSTLMQILGLLDRPSGGEFLLDGRDVTRMDEDQRAELRSKKIGFIFQFFNLLARTTCIDNVALPMIYAGTENREARARALLLRVGLSERLSHRPHQLSGGQQQRVAIARALANGPQLIFADEPTGNLSSEMTEEVLKLLEELNQEGVTIVLVTHEPEVAKRARRLISVRDGRIESDRELRALAGVKKLRSEQASLAGQGRGAWARLRESFRMALVALTLNRTRTALATLGVVIGIASVVAMVAVGQGAREAVREQLASLGTNILNIRAINPKTSKGASADGFRKFEIDDYKALKKLSNANSIITRVDANVYGSAMAAYQNRNVITEIVGAQPAIREMQNYHPVAGRFFTEEENESRARVAVIGQTVARNLFGEGANPIGATVKINRIDFTVIGLLPAKGASAYKDRDDQIILPLHTAMQRVLGKKMLNGLAVEVAGPEWASLVASDLTAFLRERRHLDSGDPDDFEVRDMNEIQKIYDRTTSIISSMLAAIAAISLIVGGIGIMNVMLVAVKERTREIGLRKAIGAKRRDILSQFLIESAGIGLLGGALGTGLGIGVSKFVSSVIGWPTVVSVSAVVIAFVFSLFVGLFFGLWPAKQASELSPIEALRWE